MTRVVLFIALFPFCAATLSARLGETEKELIARFGRPLSRSSEATFAQGRRIEIGARLTFRNEDWSIESVIVEGRCVREGYRKVGDWTEEQISTVLSSNAQGAKWTEFTKPGTRTIARDWKREDGAVAVWRLGSMTVIHPAFERAMAIALSKAKAASAKPAKI